MLRDASTLEEIAAEFKRYVNAGTNPISRLPIEITSHIFRLVRDEARPGLRKDGKVHLGWISMLGHVCHTWRQILLGACEMWAQDVGYLPAASLAFIERAGQHIDLHIHGYWRKEHTHHQLSLLRSNSLPSERIRSFRWAMCSGDVPDLLFNFFVNCAWPILHELNTTKYRDGLHVEPISTPTLFHAPNLKTWTSDGFTLPLRGPSLTTLRLASIYMLAGEFLDILDSASNLEDVKLHSFWLNLDSNAARDQIRLPRLRKFHMDGYNTPGAQLNTDVIARIEFPTCADIDICLDDPDLSALDIELLITIARGAWPHHTALVAHIKGLEIEFRPSHTVDGKDSATRAISFLDLATLAAASSRLKAALRSELERVVILVLDREADLPGGAAHLWSQVYSMFPNAQEVDFIDGEFSDLYALSDYPELLPRLQRLQLSTSVCDRGDSVVGILCDLLRRRILAGAGPNEICLKGIEEPGDNHADANALRALVPTIHWEEASDDE